MPNPEVTNIDIRVIGAQSEVSEEFLRGMVNRMIVSFHKYGPIADAYPEKVDALSSLQQQIAKYRETGNTEFLMDVANYAMIEFMRPSHPDAHFVGTDSDQSPGRTTQTGVVTRGNNDSITP